MRLYDIIQKAVGTNLDTAYRGLIGSFARDLQKAQCFELSAPVVTACATVAASKPSSIVAATPMLRLPYPSIWLEWYSDRGDYMRQNEKLIPERMGCLLVSDGEISNRGVAYWAWYHHEANLTIGPFGIAFDWDMSHPPVVAQLIKHFNLPAYLLDTMSKRFGGVLAAQAVLVNTERWYNSADKEQGGNKEKDAFISLEKRAAIIPNHHAMKFIEEYRLLDSNNPGMQQFMDDVCGELPFVEAFIIMLNSRHILERVPDNFVKLNKARVKQRKTPLREFTTTKLRLTRTSINRAKAAGVDRQSARLHLVRGHFKVRSSGVYWWSSFARGTGKPVPRETYRT